MLRLRRYRFFAIFAVFVIIVLYHFRNLGSFDAASGGLSKVESKSKHAPSEHDATDQAQRPISSFGDEGNRDEPPQEKEVEETNGVTSATKEISQNSATRTKGFVAGVTSSTANLLDDSVLDIMTTGAPSTSMATAPTVHPGRPAKDDDAMTEGLDEPNTSASIDEDDRNISGPVAPLTDPGESSAGSGRFEVIDDDTLPKIHWSSLSEHFPVPTSLLVALPTGRSKGIPTIQHHFKEEPTPDKLERERKLDQIRQTFSVSWEGYRKNAWMQDELSPVSGGYRNPFNGWAATLVDSLDTLWIMGLEREFEEAVEATKDIDFTTSARNDIPLFETTIRYLGGLIGAYDISGGRHQVLLDKAVELADVLMGAFDTPNRMPMTFYYFKPTFTSQPHRAQTRVVLAEIGSLSVEFTRLAQITKEAKYYDAIARITDEFEKWQNETSIPGLFPKQVDASGCRKPKVDPTISPVGSQKESEWQKQIAMNQAVASSEGSIPKEDGSEKASVGNGSVHIDSTEDKSITETSQGKKKGDFPDSDKIRAITDLENKPEKGNAKKTEDAEDGKEITDYKSRKSVTIGHDEEDEEQPSVPSIKKRQVADSEPTTSSTTKKPKLDCKAQGLASPPSTFLEEFTLGGMADSMYEYLPKQYLLLGGLEKKYQSMFEKSMEATKEHLLYRPMIQDETRNILFPGQVTLVGSQDPDAARPSQKRFIAEASHLGCFVGGMFGIGARIFERKEDLDIAKRLTDGCVWAYESTPTGIMPEIFEMIPCEHQESCKFNRTRWYDALDTYTGTRTVNLQAQEQQGKGNDGPQETPLRPSSDGQGSDEADDITPARLANSTETMAPASSATQQLLALSTGLNTSAENTNTYTKRTRAKRQLDNTEPEGPTNTSNISRTPAEDALPLNQSDEEETASDSIIVPTAIVTDPARNPAETSVVSDIPSIPSTEEVAERRIENEHLPPGMVRVNAPKYILRPEAIESVFIMYRITGDNYWRQKGWDMFEAIRNYTSTAFGASAISDVMMETPSHLDEMESFWLAETLKYFYLLFSDPHVVSLDEYIL